MSNKSSYNFGRIRVYENPKFNASRKLNRIIIKLLASLAMYNYRHYENTYLCQRQAYFTLDALCLQHVSSKDLLSDVKRTCRVTLVAR